MSRNNEKNNKGPLGSAGHLFDEAGKLKAHPRRDNTAGEILKAVRIVNEEVRSQVPDYPKLRINIKKPLKPNLPNTIPDDISETSAKPSVSFILPNNTQSQSNIPSIEVTESNEVQNSVSNTSENQITVSTGGKNSNKTHQSLSNTSENELPSAASNEKQKPISKFRKFLPCLRNPEKGGNQTNDNEK
jgi:hypothetical protein